MCGAKYLIPYFRSGWVFLLPYAAVYFFYVWLRWPLNSGFPPLWPDRAVQPPALLDVFRFLHGLHLVLGGIALAICWRSLASPKSLQALLCSMAPWVCLLLLHWLPGSYLEYPADPWEHWGRINRWKELAVIGTDPGWFYKNSFYFLAYSFIGTVSQAWSSAALDLYQTALCLLLGWQYFRLGRACGLAGPFAAAFTLLQAILAGNNLFGFYRYYALSSAIFAQLGAVAAVRLAILLSEHFRPALRYSTIALSPARAGTVVLLAVSLVASIAFAAVNHVQGAAIAALGLLAVVLWHGAKFGRRVVLSVGVGVLVASAVSFLLLAGHPLIVGLQHSGGRLNAWGGFDLFSLQAPAAQKMMQVIGVAGVFDVLAAVVLLKRNHVAAWLAVTPFLALQCGFISIPLAHVLAKDGADGFMAFHRFFFAIPAGLALVTIGHILAEQEWKLGRPRAAGQSGPAKAPPSWVPFAIVLGLCSYLTLAPAGFPYNNRLWHAWVTVPADLRMTALLADFQGAPAAPPGSTGPRRVVVASAAVSNALQDFKPINSLFSTGERLMHYPKARSPAADRQRIEAYLHSVPAPGEAPIILKLQPLRYLFTPQSQAACLSEHWNPVEVSLGFVQ